MSKQQTLILGLGGVAVVFCTVSLWYPGDGRDRFDPAAWKDPQQWDRPDGVRLRMVDDLLRRVSLVGQSRADVEELLGPPTHTDRNGGSTLHYWLGPERSFLSIDSEWLVLTFEGDQVVSIQVMRD